MAENLVADHSPEVSTDTRLCSNLCIYHQRCCSFSKQEKWQHNWWLNITMLQVMPKVGTLCCNCKCWYTIVDQHHISVLTRLPDPQDGIFSRNTMKFGCLARTGIKLEATSSGHVGWLGAGCCAMLQASAGEFSMSQIVRPGSDRAQSVVRCTDGLDTSLTSGSQALCFLLRVIV